MNDLRIRSRRVVLPDAVIEATVHVQDGCIAAIESGDAGRPDVSVGDAMLLPGLVDTHVHINEPGRTDWEGFESATRAAAAGGVTTLLDMPLNAIPATTTIDALRTKLSAAAGKCQVDVGFIGGVVPNNADELPALFEGGVLAWKCFLVESGVAEFPPVDELALRRVLPALAATRLPLMVHAELPGPIAAAHRDGRLTRYSDYARSRPERAEVDAVALMLRLAAESGARVHIVHLSASGALPLIAGARAHGLRVTAETCPHYLVIRDEDIPDGATEFKCAPPIRSAAHRDALWNALDAGVVDMIVSDHSPSPPALKQRETGDFAAAWGGIASLQLGLPVIWSEARARGIPMHRIARWMATAPADLVGLPNKGRIAVGCDADLIVFEPDTEWTVDGARLAHRHPLTPYQGRTLPGRVRSTYLRGTCIYHEGAHLRPPSGRLLRRDDA